jgi:sugar lactone lactonase YvrE
VENAQTNKEDFLVLKDRRVLLDGLVFPEGPRWRDGKIWFSDFFTHLVMAVDLEGNAETVVEVPGQPSGLGWLPDGRLLVVSMTDRCLLRLDPQGLGEVADLSRLASGQCNDMVVDSQGRAYVGNFGFMIVSPPPDPIPPGEIILVMPEGAARVVADDLAFPNGSVITPDGGTLIVAESLAARLTAFDIESDGSLTRRRTWAHLEGHTPDGICLDAEGAVWVASPESFQLLRVLEGGRVTHSMEMSRKPYACMLGGPDRRTLFVLTAETADAEEARAKASGRVEIGKVDVPGAGLP